MMKNYLSVYWKRSCTFCAFLAAVVVAATVVFSLSYPDDEVYIPIGLCLFFVAVMAYVLSSALKLVRYTGQTNRRLTMYSFCGKPMCELALDGKVYYEVMRTIESSSTVLECVVLANAPFEPHECTKLAQLCKAVDSHGEQIIMAYDAYARQLTEQANFYEV